MDETLHVILLFNFPLLLGYGVNTYHRHQGKDVIAV